MQYRLDPTLNWYFAEIVSINETELRLRTIDKNKKQLMGSYFIKKILNGHSVKKKTIKDVHKLEILFFIKKENNKWKIKQYPKVNGGIVVLDPFNGNILA